MVNLRILPFSSYQMESKRQRWVFCIVARDARQELAVRLRKTNLQIFCMGLGASRAGFENPALQIKWGWLISTTERLLTA
jgi:hypothetical protein